MILVDTTVWIDLFRGATTRERTLLETLLQKKSLVCITDIILTEILRGIASDNEYEKVKAYFSTFPCLTAKAPKTYIHAAELYRRCRQKGATIRSTVDCVIAAVCIENDVAILHHDSDFSHLARYCNLQSVEV